MKKAIPLTVAFLVAASLSACAAPSRGGQISADARCADRVSRAMTSTDAVVDGAVACLAPSLARLKGLRTDADFQSYAKEPPTLTIDKDCGPRPVVRLTSLGHHEYAVSPLQTAYIYLVHANEADMASSGLLSVTFEDHKVVDFSVVQASPASCP